MTPGCVCPPSFVRDDCNGHTERACRFYGLFGVDLAQAHRRALHPDGEQLAMDLAA